MGLSVGMFKVNLTQDKYSTPVQLELYDDLRETEFILRKLSDNYHYGFELWEIKQERKIERDIIVKVEVDGKFYERQVREYIVPETLNAYYLRKENILFLNANWQQREFAYKALRKHLKLHVLKPEIDLFSIFKESEDSTKVNVKRPVPTSRLVAVSGMNLSNDELVRQLLEEDDGTLNSVVVTFTTGGTTVKFSINSEGGIWLMGKYDNIEIALKILLGIYRTYVKPNAVF